jgi:nucleoside-diphosphate-sugar epimerase
MSKLVFVFNFGEFLILMSLLFCDTGGREKAPAAFCRKAITSTDKFEMWGDGLQTRSFTFIDECVEGVLR